MAFIEVVTRTFLRPLMLQVNCESLEQQTFEDWEQVLLIDEDGMGLDAANRQLADYVPDGAFVWILDDDDRAQRPTLFAEVHELVSETDADMVMVRMDHGSRGVLPAGDTWGAAPKVGRVGVSAAFIKRDLWLDAAKTWDKDGYTTDGEFIVAAFERADVVAWHDVIGSQVQRISWGAPE